MTSPSATDSPATDSPSPVFRSGGISYLHIPSDDPAQSARFYHHVFGWTVHNNGNDAGFADGTGHVIGAWVKDRASSGDAGVLPYVYVESVDRVLERVSASGGQVLREPYAEGDLRVATFQDPFGSVLGVWQRAR